MAKNDSSTTGFEDAEDKPMRRKCLASRSLAAMSEDRAHPSGASLSGGVAPTPRVAANAKGNKGRSREPWGVR